MYHTILFDLDGTLTDPGIGITNSVAYALEKYNIHVSDRSELYKFIGPPLRYSFETYYGFSKKDTEDAVAYYREYYSEKGIYENALYEGMAGLLRSLYDSGKQLLVATSKPEEFAVRILEYFDIKKYFSYVAGAGMDSTRGNKDEVIAYALELGNVSDRSSAVMVGDREYDILGAKKMGLDSIGVLFGYGSREELTAADATYIAENVSDLGNIIRENLRTVEPQAEV